MDQTALVDIQIGHGRRLIDRLVEQGIPITAASWVKESESGYWFLYLATPLVTEDGATRAAYIRVTALIREMQKDGAAVDPLDVKLISPKDPVANAVRHCAAKTPTWFRGTRLGPVAVDEAYVYAQMMNSQGRS